MSLILVIDLDKYNSVLCGFEPTTGAVWLMNSAARITT
jgi:hypothetical protein